MLTAMSQPVNKKPPLEPVAGGGALQVNGPPDGRRNSIADTEEKIQRARAAGKARVEWGHLRLGEGRSVF